MDESSNDDREIVRETLYSVATRLHIQRRRSIRYIKRLIREVVQTDY